MQHIPAMTDGGLRVTSSIVAARGQRLGDSLPHERRENLMLCNNQSLDGRESAWSRPPAGRPPAGRPRARACEPLREREDGRHRGAPDARRATYGKNR